MRRIYLVGLFFSALILGGCTVTWNARVFDLSGKEVYNGKVVTGSGHWRTPEGKRVFFSNATIIMEQQ